MARDSNVVSTILALLIVLCSRRAGLWYPELEIGAYTQVWVSLSHDLSYMDIGTFLVTSISLYLCTQC